MTPARPTSEPVPAVVGTATTGAIPAGSARVHQSPMSSKSHSGRVCPDMKATTLPVSSAEPPPNATTPSWPPLEYARSPASTWLEAGLPRTAPNSAESLTAGEGLLDHRSVDQAFIGDDAAAASCRRARRRRRVRRCGRVPPRWSSDSSNCRADRAHVVHPEMIGLRPGQLLEANARQGAAPSRILDAGPGERGIEIVAAIEEHRAGLERIAERFGALGVRRENRGRQIRIRCRSSAASLLHPKRHA